MKSQVIKVRNLPDWTHQPHTIHVKPVAFLALMGIAGIALFVSGTPWVGVGLILSISSVFALLMMPDRILIQFTPDYMILYNHRDRDTCTVIYWEDLVNWQYEFHPNYDTLSCFLTDGSVTSSRMPWVRASTRVKFPSMAGSGRPNAMEATAAAV